MHTIDFKNLHKIIFAYITQFNIFSHITLLSIKNCMTTNFTH